MSQEFKSAFTIEEIKTLLKETKNQIIGIQETIETFKALGIPEIVLDPWRERLNQCRREYIQLVNIFNESFSKDGSADVKK